VSLWKAASYAISTRLSFLTIRRLSGIHLAAVGGVVGHNKNKRTSLLALVKLMNSED